MHTLRDRIAQLSLHQRALLAWRLHAHTNGVDDVPAGEPALVAYVVPDPRVPEPTVAELRTFLKERIPEYMIPSAIVRMEALPRTPNGKVDLHALPGPDAVWSDLEESFVAPRNPVERALAAIWAEVLAFERIGVHDNFFEIGGDSILSIQIIAKARQAGLHLTPGQLFQYQTIAELASVVDTAPVFRTGQTPATGPAPLTPIQHWFFEQPLPEPHHWNQFLWLEGPADLRADQLQGTVQHLIRHHDALRLRFVKEASGWRQFHAEPEAAVLVTYSDLSALSEAEQVSTMERAAEALHRNLDLESGPLMQVALFTRGQGRPTRILISIHHLVVDPVSWRILLEDLESVYGQLGRGEEVRLPPRTSSYKDWAEALVTYAQSEGVRKQSDYWTALAEGNLPPVPRDNEGVFIEGSACTVTVSLTEEETETLLQDLPGLHHVQSEDALLAALAQSFAQWTGTPRLLVGLERHGRDELGEGIDVSRTVGWFTSYFPVVLDLEEAQEPGDVLRAVKEQLRNIPGGGIGYGLLRYLGPDAGLRRKLQDGPAPEIVFNYAGRGDARMAGKGMLLPIQALKASRDPANERSHLLEVNAFVDGSRLAVYWTYSANVHCRATIERVAGSYVECLRNLIVQGSTARADDFTPSDFPDAGLSQAELDQFLGKLLS